MINSRKAFVLNILCIAILIYGIAIMPSLFFAVRYDEQAIMETMGAIAITCIPLGILGYRILPNKFENVKMSVCYITTLTTWLVVIVLTTLPYYFSGMGYRFIDCPFPPWVSLGFLV